ncbi:hypothetical protein ARALYDRAFT_899266 [Arabidopsis lyrata subsp. lyrata]|uniref:FKB95-like N-terminal Kelch domain-containing protein n=1 Tax=Arabidopsis lyrata subsp. lyrata TaxID=81972 RepID=D7L830_ARALL|nr:hypothetical protein ARALYDRAFT_899266 [Arabidopsis lyrata subsp. lyrata]
MKPDNALTDNNKTLNNYMLLPLHASSHSPLIPYYSYGSTVAVGSDVYIIGAPDMAKPSLAVRILDCRSHAWRDGPNMKLAREGASAVYLDGKIYVMGGYKKYNESMGWMEVLDIKTKVEREVKGSNLELLLERGTGCFVDICNCGGKLLVVWIPRVDGDEEDTRRINCAKMAFKRNGGEVCGKMEWANTFVPVPNSLDILSCVVVSI